MESIVEKAMKVAVEAHAGQTRKGNQVPYIIHPVMVALLLARNGFSETVQAAALVHDVLEDTTFGEQRLREQLGDEVVNIVKVLSEDKSLQWEDRKRLYLDAIKNAPPEIKAISIADKIHNAQSVLTAHAKYGPEVWKMFNRGRDARIALEEKTLAMFKQTWDHPLVLQYEALVEELKTLS